MANLRADIDDDACRFHAEHTRRFQQIEISGPAIDIDEVHADGRLVQAHLPRPRRRRFGRRGAQFFGAAMAVDHDGGAGDTRTSDRMGGRRRPCGLAPGRPLPGGRAFDAPANRFEPRFVDLRSHQRGQFSFLARRRVEAGRPAPEGPVAVGHRFQLNLGDIVLKRNIRVDDGVAEAAFAVGQREQAFPDIRPVLKVEIAHAADLVGAFGLLEPAAPDDRVPPVMAVEIAQDFPHRRNGGVDYRAAHHLDHGVRPRSGP